MSKYDILFSLNKTIQSIYGNILNMKRYPFYLKSKKVLQRNTELLQKKKKDKCYILGLGPSLAEIDSTKLTDGDVFTVNNFFTYNNAQEFDPLLYFLMDNHYYDAEYQEKDRGSAFDMFPNATFILNGRYFSEKIDRAGNTYWLYSWKGYSAINNRMDITKIMPAFDNVVCTAIGVALYMEYKEIVLLGCDFNSFATPRIQHCYCKEGEERDMSLSFEMFVYSFVAEQHRMLNICAKKKNIEIINSTKNSLLDVYVIKNVDKYIKKES